jgi:hypothetical protein
MLPDDFHDDFPEGFSEGFPDDSPVNFLPDPPGEEYEGPPVPPSTGGSNNTNANPPATPEPSASVSWNDVPCGRPMVVIPTPGPCPSEAFATKEAIEKLQDISDEMSVLVDEALIEILIQSRPPKGMWKKWPWNL